MGYPEPFCTPPHAQRTAHSPPCLQVVATILASTTRLVANKAAWADPAKRTKIEDLAMLLRGAIRGRNKVGLKMNVHRRNLNQVGCWSSAGGCDTWQEGRLFTSYIFGCGGGGGAQCVCGEWGYL